MNLKKILLFFVAIGCLVIPARAQNPDPNFHIYLLIGQSNMAGRGPVTDKYRDEINMRVYMMNNVNQWTLAKHPLHFDKPKLAGVGPGLAFGIRMAEASGPEIRIGLLPCAVGGTAIESWIPDAYDSATGRHPYNDAVAKIRMAMKAGVIKGIIWHQGESNCESGQVKKYMSQLADIIKRFRNVVDDPTVPFIAGELGRYKPEFSRLNNELAKLPYMLPYTGLVTSDGLTNTGDATHFDSASAEELGRRFAVKMLAIQRDSRIPRNKLMAVKEK